LKSPKPKIFAPYVHPGPVSRKTLVPDVPTWWIPGQSLEEYQAGFQRDEAGRLEAIADYASRGKLKTPGQVKRLANRLGCTTRHILKWQTNPVMLRRVTDLIRMRAVYGAAEALPGQIERASVDPASFKAVLQVAKIVESGSPKNELNVTIDRRNGGDNEGAVQFIERFRERSRQGLLRAIPGGSAEVISPEVTVEVENGDE
jgi:hypothetical protein